MGRPIKPAFVGKPTDYTDGRKVIVFNNAWIPGASAVSTKPVYIIKQTGATRYLVSDGDVTGEVYLSDTVTEEGVGNIRVVYGTHTSSFFHVSKITTHKVDTFQDVTLAWSFDGENAITSMTASEYEAAITPVTPPVTPPAGKSVVTPTVQTKTVDEPTDTNTTDSEKESGD
ncbi:MAG: hypothetical protein [Caudoviricetes sp.]|nr:MAG: hypothetical protein [Caudoviricetes sp.]